MIVEYMNGQTIPTPKAGSQNRRPPLSRSSGMFTEIILESLKRFPKTTNTAARGGVLLHSCYYGARSRKLQQIR